MLEMLNNLWFSVEEKYYFIQSQGIAWLKADSLHRKGCLWNLWQKSQVISITLFNSKNSRGDRIFCFVLNVKIYNAWMPLLDICYLALYDISNVHQYSWIYEIGVNILTTEAKQKIVPQRVCIPKYMWLSIAIFLSFFAIWPKSFNQTSTWQYLTLENSIEASIS